MKEIKIIFFTYFIYSCSTTVNESVYSTADPISSDIVNIISIRDPKPEGCKTLGELYITDSGFSTNCDATSVLNDVRIRTAKIGGNYFKITRENMPNFWSSCYRVRGYVLKCND